MKRAYKKPQARTICIQSKTLLLDGSYTVNEFKRGNDITVGDEDEP